MAKRLVVCSIIGDGTKASPYRAKVADYPGVGSATLINSDPVTGAPTHTKTFALVSGTAAALLPMQGDADIREVPTGALDNPLSSFTVAQRNALAAYATEFGLNPASYTGATLLRRVLRDLIKTVNASADENSLQIKGDSLEFSGLGETAIGGPKVLGL